MWLSTWAPLSTPQPVPSLPMWRWLSYSCQLGLGYLSWYQTAWRVNITPPMLHICLLFPWAPLPQLLFLPFWHLVQWAPGWNWRAEDKSATTCSEYLKLMKWAGKHIESKDFFFSLKWNRIKSLVAGDAEATNNRNKLQKDRLKKFAGLSVSAEQNVFRAGSPYNITFREKKSLPILILGLHSSTSNWFSKTEY